jgi:translation elongation factor aEF-1 beta
MGKVGMTLRIMPEDSSMDMEALKEAVTRVVPEGIVVGRMEIVPVAFGLQALKVAVVMEDASPDQLEEVLSSIDGVQRVEIEQLGRL